MKKFNRIFLCVVSLSILLFGSFGMVEEFGYFSNFFEDLKKNSFLFNIKKFSQDISIESTTYKIFRIGDFIFAISLVIMIAVALYFYFDRISTNKLKFKLLPLIIMIFFLFFAILDIADNFLYHKKQVLFFKKESIDDIKGM
jgi:hypothetical protein